MGMSASLFERLHISESANSIIVDVPNELFESRIGGGKDEVDVMLTVWDINPSPIFPPQGFSGLIKEKFPERCGFFRSERSWQR